MNRPAVSGTARRRGAWLLSALVVLIALPAYAQTDVPSNWPLKPADLSVGDEFRLLLMARNGMKATSTDIADYDAFVREIIGRIGHAHIREYASHFKVLASTAALDARDHTGTRGVTDIPTYWLNGPIVATSYSDLFDGAWPNKDAARLQDGVPVTEGRKHQAICTGSTMHGEATTEPLGADTCTATTIATSAALGWRSHPKTHRARYLALSDVFRVVDSTIVTTPTVTGLEITSDPGSDGDYVAGDVIEVRVTFSEPVAVTGAPRLKFSLDPIAKLALYSATESTATELAFQYSVTAADYAYEGISFPRNALDLNGGTIQNQAGTQDADPAYQAINVQRGHLVYIRPSVSRVTVASTPAAHGIYVTGETITLDLTWDRKFTVFGTPLLHFNVATPEDVFVGGPTRTATYTSTIGGSVTRFEYEVQAEDSDPDGISMLRCGNIQWNGGHIIRQGHGDHADKNSVQAKSRGGNFGLPAQPGHRVNVSPSTDAALRLLQLLDGDGNAIALNPAFEAATASYTASVAAGVDEIAINAVAEDDPFATIEYLDGGDNLLADGDANEPFFQASLSTGANTIKARVTANDEVTTRIYTLEVFRATAVNDRALGLPEISGTAQVGETLSASKGTITDADGTSKADNGGNGYAYSYQWMRLVSGEGETDIGTSDTYTLVAADLGHPIMVKASFRDDADNAEGPLESEATAVVRAAGNAPATGKPTLSGPARVGETLTAGIGAIADLDGVPGTVTYQWLRVDADGTSNPTHVGANSSTYTPVAADVGKKIRVEVSFTDGAGNAEGPLASDAVPKAGTVVAASSTAFVFFPPFPRTLPILLATQEG